MEVVGSGPLRLLLAVAARAPKVRRALRGVVGLVGLQTEGRVAVMDVGHEDRRREGPV